MIPWWQTVLGGIGVVFAAIIAGSFAVRNARKTPHETLKTLVEIAEKAEGIIRPEDRAVLEAAVHREIQRIDRLNRARLEGFWRYWMERTKQSLAIDAVTIDVGLGAIRTQFTWRLKASDRRDPERWLREQIRAGRFPSRRELRKLRITEADIEAAIDKEEREITPGGPEVVDTEEP